MEYDYTTYLSPFSWRYGSPYMRHIWSEENKRRIWRKLWVGLAEALAVYNVVRPDQVNELRKNADLLNISRSLELEAEIQHDLMAEIKAFAEQCPSAKGIIHLGATSMDIKDNADVIRIRESLEYILTKLELIIECLCDRVHEWCEIPVIGFTHLQPAEPTTLGYRVAQYLQDLWLDWENLKLIKSNILGKGLRGAVGTNASFADLVGSENLLDFEQYLSDLLEIQFFPVVTQVYPRKQDYQIASGLAGLGASFHRMMLDLRFLQSSPVGEWAEPFGDKQVGSSAMPFKRNPINAEKVDSLARLLAQYPRLAWDNSANSLLENTLDDSANRRTHLPEMFLIADELIGSVKKIMDGLIINKDACERNLKTYGVFAATERVLMAACLNGGDRQEIHENLRAHSLVAWRSIQQGGKNPLFDLIIHDELIRRFIDPKTITEFLDAGLHIGNAPARARLLVEKIRSILQGSK